MAFHRVESMTDLAAATALSVSRISRVADAMQTRGWVVKQRDANDARGSVASLTAEGSRRCSPRIRRIWRVPASASSITWTRPRSPASSSRSKPSPPDSTDPPGGSALAGRNAI